MRGPGETYRARRRWLPHSVAAGVAIFVIGLLIGHGLVWGLGLGLVLGAGVSWLIGRHMVDGRERAGPPDG